MHVLIDKERMVFLGKHPSVEVLANLAWIESHESPIALFPSTSARSLTVFTELELRTLYFNTTGHEFPQNKYAEIIQILYDIMHRLPVSDVNAFELEAQAQHINDDAKHRYQYVRGSNRPAKKNNTFWPDPVTIARNENEELMAMKGVLPAYEAATSKPQRGPVVRTGSTTVVQPAKQAQPREKAPPVQGENSNTSHSGKDKKSLIWGTIQKLWEDAGSPQDVSKILKLRKTAMDILEKEHGISRTSASSSMAGWQKTVVK